MKNNHLIVTELVNALYLVCQQVNVMMELTGRTYTNDQMQSLVNARVEEFKILYSEIPRDTQFAVDLNIANVLFISSNQVFRDFANEADIIATKNEAAKEKLRAGFINTLH